MSAPLRIAFLGTPAFAAACLEAILESKHHVIGVVTAPDRPSGRGHKLTASAVKECALKHRIPVLQPEKLRDPEFINQWDEWRIDVAVVVAFRMMPEVLWNRPALGTVNLHASLLPQLRGAAPIQRAIMAGFERTGVTTFRLQHEIDTGDILGAIPVSIGTDVNAGELHDLLLEAGKVLLIQTLDGLTSGTIQPVPQDQLSSDDLKLIAAPKLFKKDTKIDWNRCSKEVHNHVRGLHPFPGAWATYLLGENEIQTLKIQSGAPIQWPGDDKAVAGTCLQGDSGRLIIRCQKDAFQLQKITPPGKKSMDSAEWLRGLPIGTKDLKMVT